MVRPRLLSAAVLLLATASALPLQATEFVVTNTNDSGPGSLREVILNGVNVSPGPHRIVFNIPGEGVHVIQLSTFLPSLNYRVAIDATTQPGYVSFPTVAGTPLIELDGSLTGGVSSGLLFVSTASGSSIRGLSIGNFGGEGIRFLGADACTVAANHLGCDASGTVARPNSSGVYMEGGTNHVIGGSTAKERNIISGNTFSGVGAQGASGIRIQGNYIGTNASGTTALPNLANGIAFNDGERCMVGGANPGEGNLISGNGTSGVNLINSVAVTPGNGHSVLGNWIGTNVYGSGPIPNQQRGINLSTSYSTIGASAAPNVIAASMEDGIHVTGTSNVIQNNFVGTSYDGTHPLGNGGQGVEIFGSSNELLGNVIGANTSGGVRIGPNSTENELRGNSIGTNSGGSTLLGNNDYGVDIESGNNNFVGGPLADDGNLIAFNPRGVFVISGTGNSLRRNRIYNNTTLNIDLGGAGVTANDGIDNDVGANNLQNFPTLSSVTYDNGTLTVQGSLLTNPLKQVVVDIFSSPSCHPTGYGGGETWVGSVSGATDAAGLMPINFQRSGIDGIAGYKFTATATQPEADGIHASTSEFSQCVTLAPSVSTDPPATIRPPFALGPPHPQPARGPLQIPFSVPRTSRVTVQAFDAAGRLVATAFDEVRAPGVYEVPWNTGTLPAGAYRLRLEARSLDGSGERFTQSRPMVVVH